MLRPVQANRLNGKEVAGAALNRLLRLAFTLVRKQEFYQSLQLALVTNQEVSPASGQVSPLFRLNSDDV